MLAPTGVNSLASHKMIAGKQPLCLFLEVRRLTCSSVTANACPISIC